LLSVVFASTTEAEDATSGFSPGARPVRSNRISARRTPSVVMLLRPAKSTGPVPFASAPSGCSTSVASRSAVSVIVERASAQRVSMAGSYGVETPPARGFGTRTVRKPG
jgi:hypothetical protein